MDTKEIIDSIEYQWGTIQTQTDQELEIGSDIDSEHFGPKHPCRIVRMSVGRLLVRVEDNQDFATHTLVAIDVPIAQGLVKIKGLVERVNPKQDQGSLVSVIIADLDVQQRRKEPRYACQYPCRYTVMRPGETIADIRNRPQSVAQVVDISLNGLQFKDQLKLPTGTRVYMEIMLPDARVGLVANVIHVFHRPPKSFVYGVKFVQLDDLAISQLNRIVLQLRRREHAEGQRNPQNVLRSVRRRR